jgi:hypothetical protein
MGLPTWISSAWTTKEITGGDKKIAARLDYFLRNTEEGKKFYDKYVSRFPNNRKAYHPELAALLQVDLLNGNSYEKIARTLEAWLELKEEFERDLEEEMIRFNEKMARMEARGAAIDYIVFAVMVLVTLGLLYLLSNL